MQHETNSMPTVAARDDAENSSVGDRKGRPGRMPCASSEAWHKPPH